MHSLPWYLGTVLLPFYFRTKPLMASMRMPFVPCQITLLKQRRFFGKAVLGLIQAFSFNWLYFEIGMGVELHQLAMLI